VFVVTAMPVVLFSNGLTLSHYKAFHFTLSHEADFPKRGLVACPDQVVRFDC